MMKTVNDIPDWLHNLVVYHGGKWPWTDAQRHAVSDHTGSWMVEFTDFQTATRLITGEPSDSDAPEWANWKAQDTDGVWVWIDGEPIQTDDRWAGVYVENSGLSGQVLGSWRNTLKPVNRSIDRRPIDEYEQQGWDEHQERMQKPDSHYSHQYKGIKLDPYRIAWIYRMQGGPREQIMKKCLRFTDKGQTEQQVVDEIRSALNRWQAMLDEDGEGR